MSASPLSRPPRKLRSYRLYGVSISSELPLPFAETQGWIEPEQGRLCEVEIRVSAEQIRDILGQEPTLQPNSLAGFYFSEMPDGSTYVRWDDLGEVLISKNGESVTCHRFPQTESESFHAYLLGHALSFALVKSGFEPLHATAIAVGDRAIAFLGDCGRGKSTLAAAFLQAGQRLLTDDLLLLRRTARGVQAFPGPPRIKLFPNVASTFLANVSTGIPLNPKTQKQIIPLNNRQICSKAVPLAALYVLAPSNGASDKNIHIEPLTAREAFFSLLSNTFNRLILDPGRLWRQFQAMQSVANVITARELSYPRSFEYLPMVRQAILSEAFSSTPESAACEA